MAEGRAGARLREIADRLDEMGEDFKGRAEEAINRTIERLSALTDKAESGEEITDEDEGLRVDNTLPGDLSSEEEQNKPPEATQLPS